MKAPFELENITLTVNGKDDFFVEEIVIAIKTMLKTMNHDKSKRIILIGDSPEKLTIYAPFICLHQCANPNRKLIVENKLMEIKK